MTPDGQKRVCGWCSAPPGARPPHCYGKRPYNRCGCPCVKKRKVKRVKPKRGVV